MSSAESDIDVDPDQVVRWLEADGDLQIIDVREVYERDAGHIAESRHVELAQLSSQASTIDRARPVVFYCRLGARSAMAAEAFRASGYDAYSMRGGLVQWVADRHPIAPDGGYVADH
jgi:rhodanese-related sulfurtransferase